MSSIRRLCNSVISNKHYFVTTPIYYVNAAPHLGHLYSSVIADFLQRWHYMCYDDKILFSTGTDEHGTKIQQAASKNNTDISDYCTSISNKYVELFKTFNIDYTQFIRTTENRHQKAVSNFWDTINKNGYIYSSQYEGWYCVSDETFLTNSQLKEQVLPNGEKILVSLESGHPVEWTQEQNYIFKLSKFQDDLKYWLKNNEDCIRPSKFHRILFEMVDSDAMQDVSISRPSARVHWGIPVPGDAGHTIYVWMDALVNYLTVAGYPEIDSEKFKKNWPPDVQVIGKDILKFHGIYWPAFLLAAKLDLPKTLFCHSHWTVDGQKMSKSKQNVICPFEKSFVYSTDGLRYFLLREGVSHSDGNYSDLKLTRILNSELADTLGNLLNRCTGKALNPKQEFPKLNAEGYEIILKQDCTKNLIESVQNLPGKQCFPCFHGMHAPVLGKLSVTLSKGENTEECRVYLIFYFTDIAFNHYNDLNFYKAIDAVVATLHTANLFFETVKPWELRKCETTVNQLEAVLNLTLETLRTCGIILQPVIPELSQKLLDKITVDRYKRRWRDIRPFSWEKISENRPLTQENLVLFKRIILEKNIERKEIKEKKEKKGKSKIKN